MFSRYFSLLSEPKLEPETPPKVDMASVSREQKVVMASKAGRLLRSVRLLLAR